MEKCQGIFGKLFGHSYRPAITRGAPTANLGAMEGSSSAVIELINSTRPETLRKLRSAEMCKPRIIFRGGRWVVTSGTYPGCYLVGASGWTVSEAWANYVRAHNACATDYVNGLQRSPGDICFVEMEQARTSLLERVRRFISG